MMKTKSLVNAAMMMAIYLVFFILYNIGILPGIMTILLPIPLIIYSMVSKKAMDVIWLLVGCCIGSYLVGSIYGLMTTLLYGGTGVILGIGMMKNWMYWHRILNATILFVIGMPLITQMMTGINMTDMFLETMNSMFTMFNQLEGMLPEENVSQLATMQQMMQTFVPMIMPTILVVTGGIGVYLSDRISRVILKRMNLEEPKGQAIGEFQLGSVMAVVLMVTQLSLGLIGNTGVSVILLNVVMLLNVLFMIQGAVVAIQFFKSRNQKGFGIFVVILAFISNLSMIVSLVGMMDALFDYRKRFITKGS